MLFRSQKTKRGEKNLALAGVYISLVLSLSISLRMICSMAKTEKSERNSPSIASPKPPRKAQKEYVYTGCKTPIPRNVAMSQRERILSKSKGKKRTKNAFQSHMLTDSLDFCSPKEIMEYRKKKKKNPRNINIPSRWIPYQRHALPRL